MKTLRIDRRTPVLTLALIAANALMFAVELLFGALGNTAALVALGAQEPVRITIGQWWRLISATFLHGSIEHILFNMLSVWIWGRFAEAMQGRVRYALVYFLSGLSGSILSYAMSPTVSVGASGALFGLFGSFLYLRVFDKHIFDRIFGTQVLVLIGVNLAMGFFRPNIDLWGHIGGLIGGFLIAAACGLYGRRNIPKWRILGATGYVLLFGGVLLYGYIKYATLLGILVF